MKRVIVLITLSIVLTFIFSLSVASAENSTDATLSGEVYTDNKSGNLIISATFSDISVKDGIISIEYDLIYDENLFELVNVEHIIPKKWENLIETEMVEDFSFKSENNVYHWAYAVIAVGKGATENDSLGIKAEFKFLSNSAGVVQLVYDDLRGEIIENGKVAEFVHMSSNSLKFTIDPKNVNEARIQKTNFFPEKDDFSMAEQPEVSIDNSDFENDKGDGSGYLWLIIISVAVLLASGAFVFAFLKRKGAKDNA